MPAQYGRRRFLKRAGVGVAAVTVAGFNPISRQWIGTAQADSGPFAAVPKLDGTLVFDDASRDANAQDKGNIRWHRPAAVLRPGSVRDIAEMVKYCGQHGIKVSARGAAHTVYGQGLVSGLLIEMRSLRQIHSISAHSADVDAGVLWRELNAAAYAQARLTPPVLTGTVAITVGGTLAVGGVDGNTGHYQRGLQIDQVSALEVVTGQGDIVHCSAKQNRDLFDAMLGGLGQCGIITRATVNLVPVQPMVRIYRIHYTDAHRFFTDMRILLDRGEVDGMYNLFVPPATALAYELTVYVHFDPGHPPNDRHLLRGLGLEAAVPVVLDLNYLESTKFLDDVLLAPMQAAMNWDRLVKPWHDVWLPGETVEKYVTDMVASLGPDDIGPGGFFLVIPQRRSAIKRPFFRVPESASGWVFLVDLLSASLLPGPNPEYAARKLARNNQLYAKARAAGGTRYPIGAIDFTPAQWREHYGPTWNRFSALKRRFDPKSILAPGVGVF